MNDYAVNATEKVAEILTLGSVPPDTLLEEAAERGRMANFIKLLDFDTIDKFYNPEKTDGNNDESDDTAEPTA